MGGVTLHRIAVTWHTGKAEYPMLTQHPTQQCPATKNTKNTPNHIRIPNPLNPLRRSRERRGEQRELKRGEQREARGADARPGTGKRSFMPRFAEIRELTPYGMVLTNYMWNRRRPNQRPMTTSQLAIRIGVPRQSVNNWIYLGNVPPLETVLAVLAKLDIPMRELYDAYKLSGLPVPRWDAADTEAPQAENAGEHIASRGRKATTFPAADAPELPQSPATDTTAPPKAASTTDAPSPRPYVTPEPLDHATEAAAEWDRIIAQTAEALRAEGLPEASIEAAVASLRTRQSSGPTPTERRIAAEHSPDPHEELREQPTPPQSPQPDNKTSVARRSDSRSKNPAK